MHRIHGLSQMQSHQGQRIGANLQLGCGLLSAAIGDGEELLVTQGEARKDEDVVFGGAQLIWKSRKLDFDIPANFTNGEDVGRVGIQDLFQAPKRRFLKFHVEPDHIQGLRVPK